MGFSRQQYWSGLPCPSPGDLPDLLWWGIKPSSPALASGFVTAEPPGKPVYFSTISMILKSSKLQACTSWGRKVAELKRELNFPQVFQVSSWILVSLLSFISAEIFISFISPFIYFYSFISFISSAYMSYKVERTLERFLCPSLCHKIKGSRNHGSNCLGGKSYRVNLILSSSQRSVGANSEWNETSSLQNHIWANKTRLQYISSSDPLTSRCLPGYYNKILDKCKHSKETTVM